MSYTWRQLALYHREALAAEREGLADATEAAAVGARGERPMERVRALRKGAGRG